MRSFKFLLPLLAISLFSACKKQLDILPPDQVSAPLAFSNVASLEKAMIGVYAQLNGSFDNEIYASVLYSDEANLHIENNTGRGVNTYRWQVDAGSGDITAAWASYYFVIDRANRVIAGGEKLVGANATEETQRKRIIGEATAIRAYCHLQLLINYAEDYNVQTSLGVPYMKISEISKPSRPTVADGFANIKTDLTTALGLIPVNFTNKTRITLPAIYAIQARAALYAKDWDGAIAASTAAINAVPLASMADYPKIWTDATENEVIFKTKRVTGQARLGDSFYDRAQAKIMYAVSYELLGTFTPNTDIRYASTVFQRGADRYSIGKYIGGDAAEPGRADVKNFRTAEMYLIRAEAYAQKNNLLLGSQDLNTLRRARITGYVDEVFASTADLITAVLAERFKELAFEGHRINDLRRFKLPITRIPADVTNALGAVTLNPTDKVYFYPIPLSEMQANENMVQNPTYR